MNLRLELQHREEHRRRGRGRYNPFAGPFDLTLVKTDRNVDFVPNKVRYFDEKRKAEIKISWKKEKRKKNHFLFLKKYKKKLKGFFLIDRIFYNESL